MAGCAIVLLATVLIPYGTRSLWLPWIAESLVDAGPPHRADIVVVLAGDYSGNRILKGAELVRSGFSPKVLVSGPKEEYGHSEDELAIPFAVDRGYPESYFVGFPNGGKSTAEEADRVVAALRNMKVRSINLVTSDIHTRRAGKAYRSRAGDIAVYVVAAPSPQFTPQNWWKDREGRKAVFLEWTKTVATWLGI
jgi:uncharacterized SAM-binding protein YcdF (DUF218 family)